MPAIKDDVTRMYAVADDYEADQLDELRRRAGLIWECDGGNPDQFSHWTNPEVADRCERCGRPRPTHTNGD